MVPANASTTTSESTQHHLSEAVHPIHQLLDAKGNPQAGGHLPTTKGYYVPDFTLTLHQKGGDFEAAAPRDEKERTE